MSKRDDLIAKVSKSTTDDLEKIVAEVWEYCNGAKNRGKPKEFLDHLHPMVVKALNEEQRELVENGPKRDENESGTDSLEKDSATQLAIANQLLNDRFKRVKDFHQGTFYCEVTDLEHQILRPFKEEPEACKVIENVLSREVTQQYRTVATRVISEMRKLWMNHAECLDKPSPMLRPEEPGWCYHRPLVDVREGPIPQWDSIINRMSDREAFSAWVWGVYGGDYRGRQMCWLHGEHGEDGKSAVAKLIGELFGPACEAICNAQFNGGERRFVTSFFVNSRLVIYPDANNTHALLSETFKMIASAGSDLVPIEFKGKTSYSDRLSARMLVCSNVGPHVTGDNFLTSRLLYIHIDKMNEAPDVEAPGRLRAEMPHFLHYAKTCYEKVCTDNYEIKTIEVTKKLVTNLYQQSFEEFGQIFDENFVFTGQDSDYVTGSQMKTVLDAEGLKGGRAQKEFHSWIVKKYGIEKALVPKANTYIYNRLAFKGAENTPPNLDFDSLGED